MNSKTSVLINIIEPLFLKIQIYVLLLHFKLLDHQIKLLKFSCLSQTSFGLFLMIQLCNSLKLMLGDLILIFHCCVPIFLCKFLNEEITLLIISVVNHSDSQILNISNSSETSDPQLMTFKPIN